MVQGSGFTAKRSGLRVECLWVQGLRISHGADREVGGEERVPDREEVLGIS